MPKTYKTEIIGYTFSELERDVQERMYQDDGEDFSDVQQHVLEDSTDHFKTELEEEFGATDIELFYDVAYSQGSGACFTAHFDVDTMLANLDFWQDLCDDINAGNITIDEIRVERCGPSNFYCHENTCQVVITWIHGEEQYYDESWIDLIANAEKLMTEIVRDRLRDFAYELRGTYEEAVSFASYCEYMSDSDAVFTEDGNLIDPVFMKDATVINGVQLGLDFEDHADYNFT